MKLALSLIAASGGIGLAQAGVAPPVPDVLTARIYALVALFSAFGGLIVAIVQAFKYADSRKGRQGAVNDVTPLASVVLLGILSAVFVVGCNGASTPAARLQLARQGYTATVNVLSDLRQAGILSDGAARDIEPVRAAAYQAIQSIDRDLSAGVPVDAARWDALNAALSALANAKAEAEESKRGGAASTRPSVIGSADVRQRPDSGVQRSGAGAYGGGSRRSPPEDGGGQHALAATAAAA